MRSVWGALLVVLAVTGCRMADGGLSAAQAAALTGGDPRIGRARIRDYGCMTCHTVPGVPGARGAVGPPLGGVAGRMIIAGVLSNTPDNLMRWIRNPPAVAPQTAMPNTGVTAEDAQHIAAYLYTLR